MNPQMLVMLLLMVIVGMAAWANMSKRDKILCTLWRVNKTRIVKWVKIDSRYVIFEKKRFDVVPSCVTWRWWNMGIIHMLFPITVATYDYIYNNRWPIDPYTGKPVVITPEVRAVMNKEEWAKSYYRSAKAEAKPAKVGLIQMYLPWIAIGMVVLIAFYFNSKMTEFGSILDNVVGQLNMLTK